MERSPSGRSHPDSHAPVTIIGGGISGMATAWFLHRRGVEVQVIESRDEVGGSILSTRTDGYLVEHGPNSTLQKPLDAEDALGRLITDLEIKDRLLVAGESANTRYILRDGRLIALPLSPLEFITSRAFSWPGKLRLLAEPFIGRGNGEESIGTFVRRRLGQEFLDYAIEPFISGVYAGNPDTLSVQAAVPRIYDLEKKYGSLVRGAIAKKKVQRGAGMPQGRMVSFDGGMGVLPQAIASELPPETVITQAKVIKLEPSDSGWRVYWEEEGNLYQEDSSRVVIATPAVVAEHLVAPFCPAAARSLRAIPYAPIASIALGYSRDQVEHSLDGFGFLIPRREQVRTLGCLFSSSLFPERAPAGKVLLTAFIGGASNPELMEWSDEQLVDQVQHDLAACLGITGRVEFLLLTRYSRAIPQYTMGHLERIAEIDRQLAKFPGLRLRANWRDGISVADCIRNAEKLAEELTATPRTMDGEGFEL